jgi:hypothetical protein
MPDEVKFIPTVEFKCHHCGAKCVAGFDQNDNPGLLHALPMCAEFERLRPDEFMIAHRRSISAHA